MNPPPEIPGLEHAGALPARPLHLAMGMFDGVHLGHRSVIDSAIQSARRSGGLAGVLTFWPHPSEIFHPEDPVRMIQDPQLKARHLLAAGVDVVISQPFTRSFAEIEAEDFLPYLQRHLPQLKAVYVGENWRFGRGRRGDIALLVADARRLGLAVVSAQRINHNGEPISSTRIRAALQEGRIGEANALLGYSYYSEGRVQPGKHLGRTLGFPTLNLPWSPALRPRLGVYAARVRLATGGESYPAVANYGLRPTVENTDEPRLEVHLLDACPFGEGDNLHVEWLHFLRDERAFAGLDALRAQIARDRAAASEFFLR